MRTISILGSTGSIGTQTLEVVEEQKDIKVAALAAGSNIQLLEKQIRKFHPSLATVWNEEKAKELRENIGFTASQKRQEIKNYGGLGQQGYRYNIEALHTEIGKILGLDRPYNAILIGAGNLGQAIANYSGFRKAGFEIKGLFDANPKIIGLKIRAVSYTHLTLPTILRV